MTDTQRVTAAALVIGNEILSGRTKDANLPFLGAELNKLGIQMLEARVVADIESEIIEALDACRVARSLRAENLTLQDFACLANSVLSGKTDD